MDNNNMMMQMLQMMQMQNQMMTQFMMSQMTQGQPAQIPTTETPTITNNDSSEIAALREELNRIKAELEATKTELSATKTQLKASQELAKGQTELKNQIGLELSGLKKTVGKAEAYLGKTIEEVAEQGEELSGDDYYEMHKEEWHREGRTNKEMHDNVKEFKDAYKKDDEPFGKSTLWDDDMIDF